MSACVCMRCHRDLIKGGRVQLGVLWGDAPGAGVVPWDRRLMPWPSIAVCGVCALALADWLVASPVPGPDDGEAAAKPIRGAARPARAATQPRRSAAKPSRAQAMSGSAVGSQK
jgi:hypothetical protein